MALVGQQCFEVIGVPSSQGAVPRLAGGDGRAVISAALARAVEDETGRSAVLSSSGLRAAGQLRPRRRSTGPRGCVVGHGIRFRSDHMRAI